MQIGAKIGKGWGKALAISYDYDGLIIHYLFLD